MFTRVIFFAAKISFVTVSPVIVFAVKAGIFFSTGDACAVLTGSSIYAESPQPLKRTAALINAAVKNFFIKAIISFRGILALALGGRKLLAGRQGNCLTGRID